MKLTNTNNINYQQIKEIRLALLIVAVSFVVIGLIINALEPATKDPIVIRIIFSFLTLCIFIITYIPRLQKHFFLFFNILLILIFAWATYFVHINHFSIGSVSIFLASAAIVAFSFRTHKQTLFFTSIVIITILITFISSSLKNVEKISILISVVFIFIVAYYITKFRIVIEKELIESEKKYRLLTENIDDVIWIYNIVAQKFTYVSPSITKLLGYTQEEFKQITYDKLLDSTSLQEMSKLMKDVIENKKIDTPFQIDVMLIHKNGEKQWTGSNFKLQINEDNELEILGVTRDANNRKLAEIQLQQYSQQLQQFIVDKDRFISILGHDLRNPFNSILGFLNLTIENLHKYDKQQIENYLKLTYQSANQTLNLLNQLIIWHKTQSNKISCNPSQFRFKPITEEIVQELKHQANEKKISIEIFEKEPICLYFDIDFYRIIIRNLISNSIKFTHQSGRINIYASKNNSHAIIVVEDNGVGIAPDVLQKILTQSEYISTLGTNREKGTGLGLKICRELTEKCNGRLWAESELGKGSKFYLSLPFYPFDNK